MGRGHHFTRWGDQGPGLDLSLSTTLSQAEQPTPVIPAAQRLRHKGLKMAVGLEGLVGPCLKNLKGWGVWLSSETSLGSSPRTSTPKTFIFNSARTS